MKLPREDIMIKRSNRVFNNKINMQTHVYIIIFLKILFITKMVNKDLILLEIISEWKLINVEGKRRNQISYQYINNI